MRGGQLLCIVYYAGMVLNGVVPGAHLHNKLYASMTLWSTREVAKFVCLIIVNSETTDSLSWQIEWRPVTVYTSLGKHL